MRHAVTAALIAAITFTAGCAGIDQASAEPAGAALTTASASQPTVTGESPLTGGPHYGSGGNIGAPIASPIN